MSSRSSYQDGIVRRYYEHKDTIALQKLGEIVSDLYLAEGGQAQRLWKIAAAALEKVAGEDERVKKIMATKDVQGLAKLVGELTGSARKEAAKSAADEPIIGGNALTGHASTATPAPTARPGQPGSPHTAPHAPPPPSSGPPTPEQLKSALKMFRKRMKLKKLDDESRLGRSPLSSGKKSEVIAIMAPREYPPEVWQELARQGKLRHAGGSFYELVE